MPRQIELGCLNSVGRPSVVRLLYLVATDAVVFGDALAEFVDFCDFRVDRGFCGLPESSHMVNSVLGAGFILVRYQSCYVGVGIPVGLRDSVLNSQQETMSAES